MHSIYLLLKKIRSKVTIRRKPFPKDSVEESLEMAVSFAINILLKAREDDTKEYCLNTFYLICIINNRIYSFIEITYPGNTMKTINE